MRKILIILSILMPFLFQYAYGKVMLPDEKEIEMEVDKLIDGAVKVSEKNVKSAEKHIRKGIKFHDKGNYAKAIKEYYKAINIDPLNAIAYYELSMSLYLNRDTVSAYENVIRSIILDPTIEAAYISKANILDDLGYPEMAVREYDRLIDINPESFMAWLNKGITQLKMNDLRGAEASMLKSAELNATYPSPYFFLMYISSQNGFNYDEEKYAEMFLKYGQQDSRKQTVEQRLEELKSTRITVQNGQIPTKLFLLTEIERTLWKTKKHRKAYPDERGYRPSLKEERAIAELLIAAAGDGELEITENEMRVIENFKRIAELDYMDARSCIQLEGQLAEEDSKWCSDNRKKLEEYKNWEANSNR